MYSLYSKTCLLCPGMMFIARQSVVRSGVSKQCSYCVGIFFPRRSAERSASVDAEPLREQDSESGTESNTEAQTGKADAAKAVLALCGSCCNFKKERYMFAPLPLNVWKISLRFAFPDLTNSSSNLLTHSSRDFVNALQISRNGNEK